MSEWKKCKLKDICDIKSGKRLPKGSDFSPIPTEYKYIRARDIKNGVINADELVCISDEVKQKISKYIVCSNDIVITIVGASIGDVAYVTPQFDGVNLTENAVRLTKFKSQINPHYIFYILNSPEYHMLMQRIAAGAAQPKMGIYKVEAIEVAIPSIQIQNQIVEILSRYDSLIENYQKQIKLLEEAAQRFYKEWFVDLHFPGHENIKIVDGVPEGWEKKKIKDFVELQNGYAFKSSTFEEGCPYKIVTIKNVKDGVFECENVSTIRTVPEKMPNHCFLKDGDILLSLTGNVGRVCMVIGENYLLNQRVAKLKTDYPAFTYSLFRSHEMFITVCNLANGAAQQNVSPLRIGDINIVMANDELMKKFEGGAGVYVDEIIKHHHQIRFLTEARDRLLPKLMSGEIKVKF